MPRSVRVFELARELGVSSQSVLEQLAREDPHLPSSHLASVPDEIAAKLRAASLNHPHEDSALEEEGSRLIRAAFAAARASGLADWKQMTIAVLKNRMLTLTGGDFNEAPWGVSRFRDFVELFPGLLDLDTSRRPPVARLLDDLPEEKNRGSGSSGVERAEVQPPRTAMGPKRRIRSDLWRATLDYSSGLVYFWVDGEAVGAEAEQAGEVPANTPKLPTVGKTEFRRWRSGFAMRMSKTAAVEERDALDRWAANDLPTVALPPAMRGRWNADLKAHALARLEDWFEKTRIAVPDDLIVGRQKENEPPAAPPRGRDLRAFVQEVVQSMSQSELEELRLPAGAVFRRYPPKR